MESPTAQGRRPHARSWASAGSLVVVEARPEGDFRDTMTSLVALDAATGEVRWQRTCQTIGLRQQIAVDDDLVAVLHIDDRGHGLMRGYDAATGAELWSHQLSGEARGATFVDGEIVVIAGSTVRRIDRAGRLVAKAVFRGLQLTMISTTADGDIITTSGQGTKNILRIHRDTLEPVWAARIPGLGWSYQTAPLVTDDAVFFHSYSLWAMALDVATGEVRWRKKKAAGRTGVVFAGPDDSWFRGTDSLVRVRPSDGKPLWETPRVIAAAPVGPGPERVVVARRDGTPYTFEPDEPVAVELALLDARTGEELRSTSLAGVTRHWVDGDMSDHLFAVVDGLVLSGLEDGAVRAFDVG